MKSRIFIVGIAIILLSCTKNNRDTISVNDNIDNEQSEFIVNDNIDNEQSVFKAWKIPDEYLQIKIGGYEFKNNEKYHILLDSVSIMEEPSWDSAIVAILSLNDEVEILEKINMEWYKIKCGNVAGFLFGGYIAVKTLVTDIDNNGRDDYFYFRISDYNKYGRQRDKSDVYFNSHNDIYIYINGKRISTNMLNEFRTSLDLEDAHEFNWCEFEKKDNNVLIKLIQYYRLEREWGYRSEQYLHSINGNGNIAPLEISIWYTGPGRDFQTDGMDSWELYMFFDKDGRWDSFDYVENKSEYMVIGKKIIDGKVWANVIDLGDH